MPGQCEMVKVQSSRVSMYCVDVLLDEQESQSLVVGEDVELTTSQVLVKVLHTGDDAE